MRGVSLCHECSVADAIGTLCNDRYSVAPFFTSPFDCAGDHKSIGNKVNVFVPVICAWYNFKYNIDKF